MAANINSLFLVHRETGQRYPINEPVLIGRSSGDIVFSRDPKLSQQHCEVAPGKDSLVVQDLDSGNGTMIDGKRLTPHRGYILKPGSELSLGGQVFTVEALSTARFHRPRRRRSKKDSFPTFAVVVALSVISLVLGWTYWRNVNSSNPEFLIISQLEIGDIFERYNSLQTSFERQTVPASEVIQQIQIQVLGRLSLVSNRLSTYQPIGKDRMVLELQQHFLTDLSQHAQAQVRYLTSADLSTQDEMDRLDEQLEQTAEQYRVLVKDRRVRGPANNAFPTPIQPPLRLVEKEMRKALAAYKLMGEAVREQKISEVKMAEAIFDDLIPRLNGVSSKLSVLKPDNPGEKQRLAIERKIVPAFIGQLRSIANFATTHDTKYSAQMEQWSSELEKLNAELKAHVLRKPANR
jgi:hypothetical protein